MRIHLDKTDAESGTRINNVGRLDGVLRQIDKNKPLVEFAMGTISNKLFVSKYQLQLPNKKELDFFVKEEMKKL